MVPKSVLEIRLYSVHKSRKFSTVTSTQNTTISNTVIKQHLGNITAIALGGAIGSISRYTVSMTVEKLVTSGFPWGTFAANFGGCLLIGIFWSLFDKIQISHEFRLFLFTGLLGGFTTFSTYARESLQFFKIGAVTHGLWYVLLSNGIGLTAVAIGFLLGERLARF